MYLQFAFLCLSFRPCLQFVVHSYFVCHCPRRPSIFFFSATFRSYLQFRSSFVLGLCHLAVSISFPSYLQFRSSFAFFRLCTCPSSACLFPAPPSPPTFFVSTHNVTVSCSSNSPTLDTRRSVSTPQGQLVLVGPAKCLLGS